MRQYWIQPYKLDHAVFYLLWNSPELGSNDEDDKDRVVVNENNQVVAFQDKPSLREYADKHKLPPLMPQSLGIIQMDVVKRWLKKPRRTSIDPVHFLNTWNLFTDVAYSTKNQNFDQAKDEVIEKCYDKLFWGNNLPSMTPPGKFYVPIWRRYEVKAIKIVLDAGLGMFRNSIIVM